MARKTGRYQREFVIDNLLVRIVKIVAWTGLAPWKFEFPFAGNIIFTFLVLLRTPGGCWRAGQAGLSPSLRP